MMRPVEERFWESVDKEGPVPAHAPELGPCWTWTRATNIHRFAFELVKGPIAPGMFCCHKCDNRRCVNPEHLYEGTRLDNAADMVARGRSTTGDRNGSRLHPERVPAGSRQPTSKLKEADIPTICKMRRFGATLTEIAGHFRISPQLVSRILLGRSWTHVPRPE